MKIGITGANSAVGRHLLNRYGSSDDVEFVACVRSQGAAELLPRSTAITPAIVTYADPEALAAAFKGCSAILHLAGILFESSGSSYESANVGVTRGVVEAAERLDDIHLVFISALGADAKSRNAYLRSKGACENLITSAPISATIIRTPLLIGSGTAGGQTLLRDARRRQVWLLGGGKHRLRPLDVDDLCRAMLGICQRQPAGKSVHDLVGPESEQYQNLVRRIARLSGSEIAIRTVPIGLAKIAASISRMVGGHGITADVIDVITASEEVHRNADRDFAIDLTALDATIQKLLHASE